MVLSVPPTQELNSVIRCFHMSLFFVCTNYGSWIIVMTHWGYFPCGRRRDDSCPAARCNLWCPE